MKKTIARNTGIVSLGTNFSRFLGLARDMLIARFFGTGMEAGAFVVAFTLPNLLRDSIGEGAANAAFVPVLSEEKARKGMEAFWKTAANLLNIMAVVLVLVSVLGIAFAPYIVKITAPGFVEVPGAIDLTVKLTRFMFPYIFFMGLTAYLMAVLNTLGYFTVPAFANSLLNVSLIACIMVLVPRIGVYGLAAGVLIGGILQLAVHLPAIKKAGFKLSRSIRLSDPAAKKAGRLMLPRIAGTTVYQVNVVMDRVLASLSWVVGTGGIPALYFAYRLIQYPISIFSTALATAALPVMSAHAANGAHEDLKDIIRFSVRSIFFIMIPCSVGLAILGMPIVKLIYQRGSFTEESALLTYRALVFYSIGLFAYGGIKILATCFYSMGDTKTPVKTAAFSLVFNLAAASALMFPLKVGGLALATSLSAIFNFWQLYSRLSGKVDIGGYASLLASFKGVALACAPMAVFCLAIRPYLSRFITGHGAIQGAFVLLSCAAAAAAIYALSAKLLKIEEADKALKWILRKK